MQKVKYLLAVIICLGFSFNISSQSKPNIVVVMADDIGLGDIGYYHQQRTGKQPVVPTPNLDKLIEQGMRFSDAHSPSSLCAPTRFSMMTGNYIHRNTPTPWGVWQPAIDAGIEPKFTTIARIAKEGGYTTAFLGKWGLGGEWDGWPKEHEDYQTMEKGAQYYGFDYSLELPQGVQNKPYVFYENGKWMKIKDNSKLVHIPFEQTKYESKEKNKNRDGIGDSNWDPMLAGPILTNKAVDYINQQGQAKDAKPFYLYYCSQAVHVPHTPAKELDGIKLAGTTLGSHGDMIKELDTQVGMMIKALKKNGLFKNTLFVFTSDNGGLNYNVALRKAGHNSSNHLSGKKGAIAEGGHRIPFIAVWPGKIKANTQSDVPIVAHDMVATLAALSQVKLDKSKVHDSANLLSVFTKQSTKPLHKYLMHASQAANGPFYALREGDWKLILKTTGREKWETIEPIALYNLKDNVQEDKSKNLLSHPEYAKRVEQMKANYLELRKTYASTVY
ncbi:sulfatase family protein [Labilibacter marinus]|uniref:sulfatase family protein n=1 Tax=Labilibacter marinus TaxID=1477105 RepID=UPI00094F828E|nr:arylsulfatase [Labilibacter marinus]